MKGKKCRCGTCVTTAPGGRCGSDPGLQLSLSNFSFQKWLYHSMDGDTALGFVEGVLAGNNGEVSNFTWSGAMKRRLSNCSQRPKPLSLGTLWIIKIASCSTTTIQARTWAGGRPPPPLAVKICSARFWCFEITRSFFWMMSGMNFVSHHPGESLLKRRLGFGAPKMVGPQVAGLRQEILLPGIPSSCDQISCQTTPATIKICCHFRNTPRLLTILSWRRCTFCLLHMPLRFKKKRRKFLVGSERTIHRG